MRFPSRFLSSSATEPKVRTGSPTQASPPHGQNMGEPRALWETFETPAACICEWTAQALAPHRLWRSANPSDGLGAVRAEPAHGSAACTAAFSLCVFSAGNKSATHMNHPLVASFKEFPRFISKTPVDPLLRFSKFRKSVLRILRHKSMIAFFWTVNLKA